MSGVTVSISSEHVITRPPIVVPQSRGRFDVLLVQESSGGLDQTVWLGGTLDQLAAAARRLADEIDALCDQYPALTGSAAS